MSNFKTSTKTVRFELPLEIYDFLCDFINSQNWKNTTVDYYCRCLAINRLIDNGILNEFGNPNYFVIPPKLDLENISLESLRESFTYKDLPNFENLTSEHSKDFSDNGEPIC